MITFSMVLMKIIVLKLIFFFPFCLDFVHALVTHEFFKLGLLSLVSEHPGQETADEMNRWFWIVRCGHPECRHLVSSSQTCFNLLASSADNLEYNKLNAICNRCIPT